MHNFIHAGTGVLPCDCHGKVYDFLPSLLTQTVNVHSYIDSTSPQLLHPDNYDHTMSIHSVRLRGNSRSKQCEALLEIKKKQKKTTTTTTKKTIFVHHRLSGALTLRWKKQMTLFLNENKAWS